MCQNTCIRATSRRVRVHGARRRRGRPRRARVRIAHERLRPPRGIARTRGRRRRGPGRAATRRAATQSRAARAARSPARDARGVRDGSAVQIRERTEVRDEIGGDEARDGGRAGAIRVPGGRGLRLGERVRGAEDGRGAGAVSKVRAKVSRGDRGEDGGAVLRRGGWDEG